MKRYATKCNAALATALLSCAFASPIVSADDFSWDGAYAGLSVGKRKVDASWKTTSYQDPSGANLSFGTTPTASLDSNETYLNVFLGRNWQIKPQVLVGIEGRLGNANNDETHITIPGANTDFPPDYSYVSVKSGLEASLRGRAGYLVTPNVHVYGGVGVSMLKTEVSATCPADTDFCNPAMGTQSNSESKTLNGWTAGVGVEGAFKNNLFWRAEYSYADYGSMSFAGLPALSGESFGFASDVDYTSKTVTLGLGYIF